MQLKEIMTTHVQGISAEQTVREAAQVMEHLGVGSVPVFRNDVPVGIVTDRDIVVRAVAAGIDCYQTSVGEIMSSDLVTMAETTEIAEAAREMEDRRIRRVLVTNHEGNLVGVVSIGDIAAKVGNDKISAELIEKVSTPAQPKRGF